MFEGDEIDVVRVLSLQGVFCKQLLGIPILITTLYPKIAIYQGGGRVLRSPRRQKGKEGRVAMHI